MKEICRIEDLEHKQRISDVGHFYLKGIPSKSMLKKLLKHKAVYINGDVAYSGDFVQNGDEISFERDIPLKPNPNLNIPVVFQDEHLSIVVKPFGLAVSGNRLRQLDNALPYLLTPSPEKDALINPQPIHRLDAATYGLVIVAKSYTALSLLNKQIESRQIQKHYDAIVIGQINSSVLIEHPIEGKASQSFVRPIQTFPSARFGHISHISLKAISGRTHQLRIHLSEIGHPIMGDRLYCPPDQLIRGKGLYLVASRVKFDHPILENPIEFSIDLPKKFISIIEKDYK